MYEATRLAYLEALGVTNWIPRQPLGGVPVRPPALLLPEPEPEPALSETSPTAGLTREAAPSPAARIEVPRPGKPKMSAPVPVATPEPAAPQVTQPTGPAAEPVAPFYLQLWQSGPCLLLIEAPEPGLESAMPGFLLLQDILRAVQLPDRPSLLGDFRWPLNRNPQLDRSAGAASLGLQAFMRRRVEGGGVVSLGCFGSATTLLVDADLAQADNLLGCEEALDDLPPAWFAPDLDTLLRRPASKAELWALLRRVRSRWQETQ